MGTETTQRSLLERLALYGILTASALVSLFLVGVLVYLLAAL